MKPNHALLITALSPVLTLAASAQNPSVPPPPPPVAYGASPMGTRRYLQQPDKHGCVWTAG